MGVTQCGRVGGGGGGRGMQVRCCARSVVSLSIKAVPGHTHGACAKFEHTFDGVFCLGVFNFRNA